MAYVTQLAGGGQRHPLLISQLAHSDELLAVDQNAVRRRLDGDVRLAVAEELGALPADVRVGAVEDGRATLVRPGAFELVVTRAAFPQQFVAVCTPSAHFSFIFLLTLFGPSISLSLAITIAFIAVLA